MSNRLESSLSVVLTIAAALMAMAVVRREFFPPPIEPVDSSFSRLVQHDGWQEARSVGIEVANSRSPVRFVLFLDLECPACALHYSRSLRSMARATDSADYSLVFVHRPLSIHRHAIDAALASECAFEQNAFVPFVEAALDRQGSFAEAPWVTIAKVAEVSDLKRFSDCMTQEESRQRVLNGSELASRMGINATPTLLLNGWELPVPRDSAAFRRLVSESIAGREVPEILRGR